MIDISKLYLCCIHPRLWIDSWERCELGLSADIRNDHVHVVIITLQCLTTHRLLRLVASILVVLALKTKRISERLIHLCWRRGSIRKIWSLIFIVLITILCDFNQAVINSLTGYLLCLVVCWLIKFGLTAERSLLIFSFSVGSHLRFVSRIKRNGYENKLCWFVETCVGLRGLVRWQYKLKRSTDFWSQFWFMLF